MKIVTIQMDEKEELRHIWNVLSNAVSKAEPDILKAIDGSDASSKRSRRILRKIRRLSSMLTKAFRGPNASKPSIRENSSKEKES